MVAEQSSTDRVAMPREGMDVRGAAGKLLGKVEQIAQDPTGQLTSITIQHGLFGRKHKLIPAQAIKQVTDDAVALTFTVVEFKELPDIG